MYTKRDLESQMAVLKNHPKSMSARNAGRTRILITHRRDLTDEVDLVYDLENGRLRRRGEATP